MGDEPSYRILRVEDMSFLNEARAEIDLCHQCGSDYQAGSWLPLPIIDDGWYDLYDTSRVIKSFRQYTYHNFPTNTIVDSLANMWCVNWFGSGAQQWNAWPMWNLIDKRFSFTTNSIGKIFHSFPSTQNNEWVATCLGINNSDRRALAGREFLQTEARFPYKLETVRRCFANIKDIQNCATISMSIYPYRFGNFDEIWAKRAKGVSYTPHWDPDSQTYTGWDRHPYGDTNTVTISYLDKTSTIGFNVSVVVSKSMSTVVYEDPSGEGPDPQYLILYQEYPNVEYSYSGEYYHGGTTKPPYDRGFSITLTYAGNHDRLKKIDAIALVEVEFTKSRSSTKWNNIARRYDTVETNTNGVYFITCPITLSRVIRPTDQFDPNYDNASTWAWVIDGLTTTKDFFRSLITTEVVPWDDDYERNIGMIDDPVCPEIAAGDPYGRTNRTSGSDDFTFTLYHIAIRTEWDYTTTFR